ncbi:MAG TPA: tetratricopeptide repeat protein [Sedimentisphaerales bacterium]|nr:tetratricopeptide repeat protein [Sedimentisphaerales bacterium]
MKKITLLICDLFAIVLFMTGVNLIGKESTKTEKLTQEGSLIEKYKRLADEGDTSAMCSLGRAYFEGRGVPQDYTKAVELFRKGAEAGDPNAMVNLGFLYDIGRGVSQDYTEAAEWFRKSAEAGNIKGMSNLGVMYTYGRGIPQDYTKAIKWLRKSAEAGNSIGMMNLGLAYFEGKGVPKNSTKALEWYRKAIEDGDSNAMLSLGLVYYEGYNIPADTVKATKLIHQAADAGNVFAKSVLIIGDLRQAISSKKKYAEALAQIRLKAKEGDVMAERFLLRMGYSKNVWQDRLIAIFTSIVISLMLIIVVYILPRNNRVL